MVLDHVIVLKNVSPLHTGQTSTDSSPVTSATTLGKVEGEEELHVKPWKKMVGGMSSPGDNIELFPVEEHNLSILPQPITPDDGSFSSLQTCFVKVSSIRRSNVGVVEICHVAKLDVQSGTVRMVVPSQHVVVKTFDLDTGGCSQENPFHEISIHQKLTRQQHPSIMPLLGCLVTSNKVFAVYPYFNQGDLFQNLSRTEAQLSEKDIYNMILQMLSALQACHEAGICHRDISLENFLVSGPKLVLIDFGLSAEMTADYQLYNYGPVGKTKYMAPELVLGKPSYVDGRKVDVWSLGIVLFMLITKSEPFHVALNADPRFRLMITKRAMRDVLISWGLQISNSLLSLLEQMLNPEPSQRPTVQEILAHPWMSEV